MLAAVIFDFDGVIVDSEPFHYHAFREVMAAHGWALSWAEYVRYFIGYDDRDLFRVAFGRQGREVAPDELLRLIERKARHFQRLVRERGVVPFPGAPELIRHLAARVPVGLCSGALRCDVRPILRRLGLTRSFRVLVTADDVPASKPDPACYLLCLERLARAVRQPPFRPADCVAIEDTPSGVTAARRAGLRVLAVTNSYPVARLRRADRVVRSLDGLGLQDCRQLVENPPKVTSRRIKPRSNS